MAARVFPRLTEILFESILCTEGDICMVLGSFQQQLFGICCTFPTFPAITTLLLRACSHKGIHTRPNVYTNIKSRHQIGPEEANMHVDLSAILSVFHLVQKPSSSAFTRLYPFLSKYKPKEEGKKVGTCVFLASAHYEQSAECFLWKPFLYVREINNGVCKVILQQFSSSLKTEVVKSEILSRQNRRISMTSVHLVKTLWQLICSKTDGSCYFHIATFHPARTKHTNRVKLQDFNTHDPRKRINN